MKLPELEMREEKLSELRPPVVEADATATYAGRGGPVYPQLVDVAGIHIDDGHRDLYQGRALVKLGDQALVEPHVLLAIP
ncbi:hypothetical protein, partial [Aeromonas salmonicida]|uniref:hypothetical protein n=1 Tax=Aeromonas salmonicida TaxID=645 RepID=UPI0019D587C6